MPKSDYYFVLEIKYFRSVELFSRAGQPLAGVVILRLAGHWKQLGAVPIHAQVTQSECPRVIPDISVCLHVCMHYYLLFHLEYVSDIYN